MTKKMYNFEVIDCRYSGRFIGYTCEDESCEEESCEEESCEEESCEEESCDGEYFQNNHTFPIELTMPPENSYIVYVINEFSNWCVEDKWQFDTLDDAKKAVLKIYSQINDHLPFKVTGYEKSYHATGFYPEIPEEIENMEKIDFEPLNYEEYYFAVIVNSKEIVDTQMLQPY